MAMRTMFLSLYTKTTATISTATTRRHFTVLTRPHQHHCSNLSSTAKAKAKARATQIQRSTSLIITPSSSSSSSTLLTPSLTSCQKFTCSDLDNNQSKSFSFRYGSESFGEEDIITCTIGKTLIIGGDTCLSRGTRAKHTHTRTLLCGETDEKLNLRQTRIRNNHNNNYYKDQNSINIKNSYIQSSSCRSGSSSSSSNPKKIVDIDSLVSIATTDPTPTPTSTVVSGPTRLASTSTIPITTLATATATSRSTRTLHTSHNTTRQTQGSFRTQNCLLQQPLRIFLGALQTFSTSSSSSSPLPLLSSSLLAPLSISRFHSKATTIAIASSITKSTHSNNKAFLTNRTNMVDVVAASLPSSPLLPTVEGDTIGSGIGTDVEMIAANDRMNQTHSPTSSVADLDLSETCTTACAHKQQHHYPAHSHSQPKPHSQPHSQIRCFSSSPHLPQTTADLIDTAAPAASAPSEMKDEYGVMDDSGSTYVYPGNFVLENGQVLPHAQLRYRTYGSFNEARDNVLVVCHALTGNASLHSWWGDLLGPGLAFDTNKYLVVCCNILGSCYGSTSPASINPETGKRYGVDFPDVSVKDTVRLQLLLLQHELKVSSVKAVIGGSFGGMQAVEFAVQAGSTTADVTDATGCPFVRSVIPIACGSEHTAWQIGISEVQRQAIYKDPEWRAGNHFAAKDGLEIARQLGMISYRTAAGYHSKFGRLKQDAESSPPYGSAASWQVKSYLEYQGSKFLSRFDPVTYVKLTEQMDSHDIARGRCSNNGSAYDVLQQVEIPALVLGIDSDLLYPFEQQQALADALPRAVLKVIHSNDGHDGFLLEQEQVAAYITDFLELHE